MSLSSVAEYKCHSSHTPFVYLWSENPWRSAARSKFHPSPSLLFASSRLLIHLRGRRRLTALRMPLRPGAVDGGSTVNKGDRGSIRHIQLPEGGSHLQATEETDPRRSSYPAGIPAIPAHPDTNKGEWQEGVSVGRTVWAGVGLKTSSRYWSIRVCVILEIIWKWSYLNQNCKIRCQTPQTPGSWPLKGTLTMSNSIFTFFCFCSINQ